MTDSKDDLKGFKVYLDKEGKPIFATYWHPELIVSKIELKEEPDGKSGKE